MPEQQKRVVIAGGSGFLGQSLSEFLFRKNYEVVVLGRVQPRPNSMIGRFVEWDAKNLGKWMDELENSYCLVNLCGRSVDCRYTQHNKELILSSRINSTQVLGEALKNLRTPPEAWLNASTATIYDDRRGDSPPHDETSPGDAEGFSEEVGREWEKEFFKHSCEGVRQVAMRISIVLGEGGGAFPVIKRFTQFGLGGAQGPGSQWMSWIHLNDWVEIANFLMENEEISGPVNLASPQPVTNREFMKKMRERFAPFGLGFPAPTPAVYLGAIFLGSAPELVLKSRKVISKVLKENSFQFLHTSMDSCLDQFVS